MKRSKSNCIPPCFRWNVLVFFISGFLFCWCSNRFSFGATSFSVISHSRTADWGPLDGSLDRWPCQPQDVPGRDAVRLWGLLSQRKTKDKTVALDRSCVSGSYFQIVSFQIFSAFNRRSSEVRQKLFRFLFSEKSSFKIGGIHTWPEQQVAVKVYPDLSPVYLARSRISITG